MRIALSASRNDGASYIARIARCLDQARLCATSETRGAGERHACATAGPDTADL